MQHIVDFYNKIHGYEKEGGYTEEDFKWLQDQAAKNQYPDFWPENNEEIDCCAIASADPFASEIDDWIGAIDELHYTKQIDWSVQNVEKDLYKVFNIDRNDLGVGYGYLWWVRGCDPQAKEAIKALMKKYPAKWEDVDWK